MGLMIHMELKDDQLELLKNAVIEDIKADIKEDIKKAISGGKNSNAPYNRTQFAKAIGRSYTTVWRMVDAGLIATTKDGRIPASEYERLTK